jgi:hypothetical protein
MQPRRKTALTIAACLGLPPAAHAQTSADTIEDVADRAVAARGATDLLLVPVPNFSPAIGAGIAPAAIVLYRPAGSPQPWTTGVVGLFTSNGSRAAGALHKMSLDHDRYRVTAAGGYGDFNLDFYGIGSSPIGRQNPIKIQQEGLIGLVDATVRTAPNLHVGVRARYLDLTTRVRSAPKPGGHELPPLELNSRVVALGPAFEFDTRDSSFAPRKGVLISGRWLFGSPDLGSDFSHSRMTADANVYKSMGPRNVLAARAALCRASRSAPFFETCSFGQSNDLRGYASGKYADHALWAVQAEWRHSFGKRFGGVLFAGVGGVARDIGKFPDETLLPAAGAGIRYKVSPEYGVNLGVDAAVGRHSHGLYVFIGEAF